ncbi:MAG TPA: hypothetical protein VLA52_10305 [Thermohalobaculum sp.]|nr:hypothetical protein [Thermohalobaculum sp.]
MEVDMPQHIGVADASFIARVRSDFGEDGPPRSGREENTSDTGRSEDDGKVVRLCRKLYPVWKRNG